MAEVIIRLRDVEDKVDFSVTFDPDIDENTPPEEITPAQFVSLAAATFIVQEFFSSEDPQEDDEQAVE